MTGDASIVMRRDTSGKIVPDEERFRPNRQVRHKPNLLKTQDSSHIMKERITMGISLVWGKQKSAHRKTHNVRGSTWKGKSTGMQ